MTALFDWLDDSGARRVMLWRDEESDLRAVTAIDRVVDGMAAGGIRTRAYRDARELVDDACALARAMSAKCALAKLPVGGCKTVVWARDGLNRPAAFETLGRRLAELGGLVRTAGDLGTTMTDLEAVALHHPHVHLDERGLADSVGRGVLRCVEACAARRGKAVSELVVAIQGCGAIGAAVARSLANAGARLVIGDLDPARAERLADTLDARVVAQEAILHQDVDVVSPNAIGGVIDARVASELRAWAVVGAANNVLANRSVARLLSDRQIAFVPDVIASAGAVIDGIGGSVLGLDDRTPLIDALGDTARDVLARADATNHTTVEVAETLAEERLRGENGSPH
ncbi:MAG TPA: hypothetical protein ENK57_18960 [Polyangiaceae bacterium]|nr:hypothetical protein [Polyangiaceae bacterium]